MLSLRRAPLVFALVLSGFFISCAAKKDSHAQPIPKAEPVEEKPKFINPYPAGTYDNFKAEPSYPKTSKVWKNDTLLDQTNSGNSSIEISIDQQRAFLKNNGEIVMDYPICSGTIARPTPTGTFSISEKIVDKKSNRYGKILDAAGDIVNSDADALKDSIPAGGKFEGASMKYWMRLTNDGIGHHIGPVRRYRASHGCVRGPSDIMPIVHSKVRVGTDVTIQ